MPHFFITQKAISDSVITIFDKDNYHHLVNSLRIKNGEKLLLIDDLAIQYETVISNISKNSITCSILKSYKSTRFLPFNIYLAQSVLKKDAQYTVIQKASELGVKGIYPLITDNSTVNKSFIENKYEKFNKIALEASKQCERPDVATISPVSNLNTIIQDTYFTYKLACVESHAKMSMKEFMRNITLKTNDNILLIIGCEGGFSEKEFELLEKYNIPMLSLGNLILRADTAVVTALSNIIYEFGHA